jgi:uncharacterized protein YcnI
MRSTTRATSRALISVTLAAATMSIGVLCGTATASAHVRVSADNATPGGYAILTFKVPNESEKGALTTQLNVVLPDVTSASTELMPGWSARLDRDVAAGTVHSVTWTAAPGTGIGADQFALFRISVKLPQSQSLSLPATQTYSDGTVVKWDQPTPADGAEAERPVPELTLTGATAAPEGDHGVMPMSQPTMQQSTDNSSRWLAGGALVVAAVALVVSALGRRRT